MQKYQSHAPVDISPGKFHPGNPDSVTMETEKSMKNNALVAKSL
jgi:hypothetical protein